MVRAGKARAAVRSCTEPGSTGETHSGNPSGASTAWMLPPWVRALPEYHKSMTRLYADGRLFAAVAGDDLAVEDDVREPGALGPLQRLAQIRGFASQHRNDLIQVPVGGRP